MFDGFNKHRLAKMSPENQAKVRRRSELFMRLASTIKENRRLFYAISDSKLQSADVHSYVPFGMDRASRRNARHRTRVQTNASMPVDQFIRASEVT